MVGMKKEFLMKTCVAIGWSHGVPGSRGTGSPHKVRYPRLPPGVLGLKQSTRLKGGLRHNIVHGQCNSLCLKCREEENSLPLFEPCVLCLPCSVGYVGPRCDQPCPVGATSGLGLPCAGHGTCTASTTTSVPTCVCVGNWAGTRCDDCTAGYWGSACTAVMPGVSTTVTSTGVVETVVCSRRALSYSAGFNGCAGAPRQQGIERQQALYRLFKGAHEAQKSTLHGREYGGTSMKSRLAAFLENI